MDDPVSGPVRVTSSANTDGVEPDPFVQANVVEPLQEALAAAVRTSSRHPRSP